MREKDELSRERREEPLEVTMAREVKALYLDTMRNDVEFHQAPTLDMTWFRKHFAAVAHRNNLFHRESPESRSRYNVYFGLVRTRVSAAIRRLAENETHRQPIAPILSPQSKQRPLPLRVPPSPMPESYRQWYRAYKDQQTAK